MVFSFLDMSFNYEERKVARYDKDGLFVSTCLVTDGSHPYETAVEHQAYNDGELVIVEAYDSIEDARLGHERWVSRMTTEPLPETLIDCRNAYVAQLEEALSAGHEDEGGRQ